MYEFIIHFQERKPTKKANTWKACDFFFLTFYFLKAKIPFFYHEKLLYKSTCIRCFFNFFVVFLILIAFYLRICCLLNIAFSFEFYYFFHFTFIYLFLFNKRRFKWLTKPIFISLNYYYLIKYVLIATQKNKINTLKSDV